MRILTKKIFFIALTLPLCLIFFSCQPSEKTKSDSKKHTTDNKIIKGHNHADRSEQAGCPICNIKLLMERGYREISIVQLKELQKSSEPFILINTLPPYFYRKEHIINSINIPSEEIGITAPRIIKPEARIVLYCKDYNCHVSTTAAEELIKLGYKNIFIYQGGMKEWKEKGNLASGLRSATEKDFIEGP